MQKKQKIIFITAIVVVFILSIIMFFNVLNSTNQTRLENSNPVPLNNFKEPQEYVSTGLVSISILNYSEE